MCVCLCASGCECACAHGDTQSLWSLIHINTLSCSKPKRLSPSWPKESQCVWSHLTLTEFSFDWRITEPKTSHPAVCIHFLIYQFFIFSFSLFYFFFVYVLHRCTPPFWNLCHSVFSGCVCMCVFLCVCASLGLISWRTWRVTCSEDKGLFINALHLTAYHTFSILPTHLKNCNRFFFTLL